MSIIVTIKNFVRRIKWLWKFPDHYEADIGTLRKFIGEHVEIHADIHMRAPNIIIAIGRYRRRDYVRIFEIEDQDFPSMIEHLRKIEPHARMGRMDVMHGMEPYIRAVFDRETRGGERTKR